jgi:hypothetical protein
MRAHNDSIALKYNFYEILTLKSDKNKSKEFHEISKLRDRCLEPGLYAKYMKFLWLKEFHFDRFLILDGDELKHEPFETMQKLQDFMSLKNQDKIDYRSILKYHTKINNFCLYLNKRLKCLGKSKGRVYEQMDAKSSDYLNEFYRRPNFEFYKLLTKYKRNSFIPKWLQNAVINSD